MYRTLLISLVCLLATARESSPTPHVVPAKVGLVLIGATPQGFALAADGSSLNADGRVSQEQRLFQAGKNGAIVIAGSVSVQDPVTKRVREEVNIGRVTGQWLATHPDPDLQTADREINVAVAAAMNKFLTTRSLGAESGAFKFAIITAGSVDGKPTLIATRYFMPGTQRKAMRAEHTSSVAQPGEIWIYSRSSVPLELLAGKSKTLEQFRGDAAVRKFRSSQTSGLAEQDYLTLFDRILKASESDQGKKLDGKRAVVAPPNRFATVTSKNGFSWSTAQN
ncbi:MAG TPA: hypothetical protein VGP89_16635 [Candidatus Angelobacter sp.]|jgi:hypothetical protein|nr:hypothetical protein [Candidatus Angelobacter sp.]